MIVELTASRESGSPAPRFEKQLAQPVDVGLQPFCRQMQAHTGTNSLSMMQCCLSHSVGQSAGSAPDAAGRHGDRQAAGARSHWVGHWRWATARGRAGSAPDGQTCARTGSVAVADSCTAASNGDASAGACVKPAAESQAAVSARTDPVPAAERHPTSAGRHSKPLSWLHVLPPICSLLSHLSPCAERLLRALPSFCTLARCPVPWGSQRCRPSACC